MIIRTLPDSARLRFGKVRFESDPLAAGIYKFDTAANKNKLVLNNLQASALYFIDSITTLANVSESDWFESITETDEPPRMTLSLLKSSSKSVFAEAYEIDSYDNGLPLLQSFRVQANADQLQGNLFGSIKQSSGMVGKATLVVGVRFVIYEVDLQEFQATFGHGKNVDPRMMSRY